MIKSIRFENFYSFKDAQIVLHQQENILIGINGSGKSNFLKAVRLLQEGVSGIGLQKLFFDHWGGFDNICFNELHDQKGPKAITLEYCFDGEVLQQLGYPAIDDVVYKIVVHKIPGISNYYLSEQLYVDRSDQSVFLLLEFQNGKGRMFGKHFFPDPDDAKKGYYETKLHDYETSKPHELGLSQINDAERFPYQYAIKQAMNDIVAYDYFDTTPDSKIRKPMAPTSDKRLAPDGSNLPQILNTLNINFKSAFKKILAKLKDVNENYSNINFHFVGGNIELMLEENHLGRAIHVTNISDGTLRFLCLLAIFYNPERGKLICLDEPENGLHPDMILNITQALQECAAETQFVVATHSENVLNAFDLDRVRVFEKNEQNMSILNCYTEHDFQGWYEEYVPVGKRWRQGDLGGNRW